MKDLSGGRNSQASVGFIGVARTGGNLKRPRFFPGKNYSSFAGLVFASFIFICIAAQPSHGQGKVLSPYPGESDGVSAGGNWIVFHAEDKMTGAKKVRFELLANNYLSQNPDYKPRIELVCTDKKYTSAEFNPGIRLGPPNRPGFWGQPQMEVEVRADDSHSFHGWNWERDSFLSMDKGTVRELIGARIFNVKINGRRRSEIAEFSPAGLDLSLVKQSCDLTPKKTSKN